LPRWASTADTSKCLLIGSTKLFRLKSEGKLEPGKHYRQNGARRVLWDVAAVDQALRDLTVAEAQAVGGQR
jgi:hypothetical protein